MCRQKDRGGNPPVGRKGQALEQLLLRLHGVGSRGSDTVNPAQREGRAKVTVLRLVRAIIDVLVAVVPGKGRDVSAGFWLRRRPCAGL